MSRLDHKVVRNLYKPHPIMIDSGTFWRCDHGVTGLGANSDCATCKAAWLAERKAQDELNREIGAWWPLIMLMYGFVGFVSGLLVLVAILLALGVHLPANWLVYFQHTTR